MSYVIFYHTPSEELVPGEHAEPNTSWEDDLDAMIPPILEDKKPCYIFFRLDERNAHQSYLWVFMAYTPDFAPVSDANPTVETKSPLYLVWRGRGGAPTP